MVFYIEKLSDFAKSIFLKVNNAFKHVFPFF